MLTANKKPSGCIWLSNVHSRHWKQTNKQIEYSQFFDTILLLTKVVTVNDTENLF